MKIVVELFAQARRLADSREVHLEVAPNATFREILGALSERHPAMLGELIVPGSHDLREPYILNIDGQRIVDNLDDTVPEGKRLLLMFASIGG